MRREQQGGCCTWAEDSQPVPGARATVGSWLEECPIRLAFRGVAGGEGRESKLDE